MVLYPLQAKMTKRKRNELLRESKVSMKTIGTQLKFATSVISARSNPVDFGDGTSEKIELAKSYVSVVMQIIVSIVVLVGGLFLLLKSQNQDVQKAVAGLMGTVVGYWLR